MKKRIINRQIKRELNELIHEEAKATLAREGVRSSLICAYLFILITGALGWLLSSLIFGVLDYFSVTVSETIANIVTVALIYLFVSPALSGQTSMAASAYRGDCDLSNLLYAFTSFGRLMTAYLGSLIIFVQVVSAILILYIPDLMIETLGALEGFEVLCYSIGYAAMILAYFIWFCIVPELNTLAYNIYTLGSPNALPPRRSRKRRRVVIGMTGRNILYAFLIIPSMFLLLIIHAGPLWTLEGEIAMRRGGELLSTLNTEKLRKDGQDK